MAEEWRLVDAEFPDPRKNLALEETLLRALQENPEASNTLRLWRNPKAVVVGRFQKVPWEVNVKLCRRLSVPILRRCSGGGAVYHDPNNLNWSLFMRLKKDPLAAEPVTSFFKLAGECVIRGLKRLHLEAFFKPPNTIAVADGKISGMAMCIRKNTLLCHGTLLVATDLQTLQDILQPKKNVSEGEKPFTRSRREKVTSLEKILGKPPSMVEVREALRKGVEETLGVRVKKGDLTAWEREALEKIWREKYSTDSWNLSTPG
ncbi:lipoate--protein ligase family protein [Candidatus Hecatella orcuttiae]|jgi:lipoate-protein ligase A|uniref:lipoate--protein ligase family protein n=1 Tax=Candidatus Hecatella orcuttiae TaxID=1935119 RepID=UPI002867D203|nr:lipoate--protein ligase family protein [Candidatus Hecatella orcuttiae]